MLPVADGPTSAAQTALTFFAVSWSSPPQMNSSCDEVHLQTHTACTEGASARAKAPSSSHVWGPRGAAQPCVRRMCLAHVPDMRCECLIRPVAGL